MCGVVLKKCANFNVYISNTFFYFALIFFNAAAESFFFYDVLYNLILMIQFNAN